jgi:hypothetical protein
LVTAEWAITMGLQDSELFHTKKACSTKAITSSHP